MLPTPRDAAKTLLPVPSGHLDAAAFVLRAGLALRNGNPRRAFLLLGAASVAPHCRPAKWAFEGALAADDLRRKLL